MDPGSAAGIALATVSLVIQLADGARKGFFVLDGAIHADEACRAFAVSVDVEHARFEVWAEKCGLNDAKPEHGETAACEVSDRQLNRRRFEDFLKYSGPVITQVLSEIHLLMTQLSSTETKYASLIEIKPEDPDTQTEYDDHAGEGEVADITEPRPVDPTAVPIGPILQGGVQGPLSPDHIASGRAKSTVRTRKAFKAITVSSLVTRAAKTTKNAFKPKRLKWVIKDAKPCERKIARLSELNGFLLESLGHAEKADLFQMMYLQMHSTEDLVQHVRALLTAVDMSGPARSSRDTDINSSGTTLVGTQSTATSALKGRDFIRQAGNFVIAALDFAGGQTMPQQIQGLFLRQSMKVEQRSFTEMAGGKNVWIEWREYEVVPVSGNLRVDPETVRRMDRLVSLLKIPTKPEEFCVPPCEGYFMDEENTRVGLVFSAPSAVAVQTPRSLLESFAGPIVSLSTRVRIAQTLALWLLHLHSVRWFHKGIRSSSVLFFTSPESAELGRPYVTGFEYARTANDGRVTSKPPTGVEDNDFYVHPDYLDIHRAKGYQQVYDIYSFGIVLIELAYWQPIHAILRDAQAVDSRGPQPSLTPVMVRGQILDNKVNVLEGVRSRVGDSYASAVEACLNGIDASNDSEAVNASKGTLLYAFNRAVIEVLDGIST